MWILENGSTDNTLEIANSIQDERVSVFSLGPIGKVASFQFGLERADSEFIAHMDGDDISLPDRFEKQIEVMRRHPNYSIVGSRFAICTPFGHVFSFDKSIGSREITKECIFPDRDGVIKRKFADASVLYRRSIALKVGGYDTEFFNKEIPIFYRLLDIPDVKGFELDDILYIQVIRENSLNWQAKTESNLAKNKYLGKFKLSIVNNEAKNVDNYAFSFWRKVALMESIAGYKSNSLEVLSKIRLNDNNISGIKSLERFLKYGKIGAYIYCFYKGFNFRHIPDFERSYGNVLSKLL